MRIAFYTEMFFDGPIHTDHQNMRTEFAWMCALKADHHCIHTPGDRSYDLGIIIIPKKPKTYFDLDTFKKRCTKVAVMQEGPNWGWQDLTMDGQIWYVNMLIGADAILTHNHKDVNYFRGVAPQVPVIAVLPSLMITNSVDQIKPTDRKGVIIGGNFTSWYGGFDSRIVAEEFLSEGDVVVAPSMGRKIQGEERLVTHLPYVNWVEWIHQLNRFKYGVHMMRTHAAGTFALNCAYLGIPCIGYEGLDTQDVLHPKLTVKDGDLAQARRLAAALIVHPTFYEECAQQARSLYEKHYTEQVFLERVLPQLNQIM